MKRQYGFRRARRVRAITTALAIALTPGLLASRPGQAYEKPPGSWTFFLSPGVTLETDQTSTFALTQGTRLESRSGADKLSRFLDAEVAWRLLPFFSLAGDFEGVVYRHADGSPNDKSLALFVVPRAQTGEEGLVLWAGCGVGEVLNLMATGPVAGAALNYNLDHSKASFGVSPRAGFDYIMSGYTLGLQASYTQTSFTLNGSAVDPTTGATAPMTDQISRHWWALAGRFGFQW